MKYKAENRGSDLWSVQRIETKKQRIALNAAERGALAELLALERSEWARSPIDGTVTAVRVESVGVDGVDVVLEMVQSVSHHRP